MSTSTDPQLGFDVLGFLFDRLEFLAGLLLGGAGVGITMKIKQKISQKQDMKNSPGGHQVIIENYYDGGIKLPTKPSIGNPDKLLTTEPSFFELTDGLTGDQKYICKKIFLIMEKINQRFYIDKYANTIALLKDGSSRASASEYRSVFLDPVEVLNMISTYPSHKPKEDELKVFNSSFKKIEDFVSKSDINAPFLREIIQGFEGSLAVLLSYL